MKKIYLLLFVLLLSSSEILSEINDSTVFEWTPLAAYDTDIGFGAGAKGFLLNSLGKNESFDLILFASTEGERWVRFAFSIPDFEVRQGTKYDWALDLVVDYDLWIKSSYFGTGPDSKFEDRIFYEKEPLDISTVFSRGFTENLVAKFGLRYRTVDITGLPEGTSDQIYEGRASAASYFVHFRYDTKDSYINPKQGLTFNAEIEHTPLNVLGNEFDFLKYGLETSFFVPMESIESVVAYRFRTEWLSKDNLPVHFLLPLGGNRTLRGSPQDRYLSSAIAISNLEFRFPIYARLGGIAALDIGNSWNRIGDFSLYDWKVTPAFGLRYYMDTFVLRADIGLSNETECIYLNVGHIF